MFGIVLHVDKGELTMVVREHYSLADSVSRAHLFQHEMSLKISTICRHVIIIIDCHTKVSCVCEGVS